MAMVALITGGGSGIGAACAERFARDGFRVAVADIDRDAADRVAGEVDGAAFTLDVSDAAMVGACVEDVENALGPIDALISSAGLIQSATTTERMTLEDHDRIWAVNYRGTYLMCRAVGARMAARGAGAMVTIGSINTLLPLPLPAYAPGKAAIGNLTQLLAAELGPAGVRVNCVAPTYTLTPALEARIAAGERDPDAIRAVHALPMMVRPEHIAAAIAFLCGPDAAAITGVVLPVDAGWHAALGYKAFVGPVDR